MADVKVGVVTVLVLLGFPTNRGIIDLGGCEFVNRKIVKSILEIFSKIFCESAIEIKCKIFAFLRKSIFFTFYVPDPILQGYWALIEDEQRFFME